MAKATPELEEMSNFESAMERSFQEFNESEAYLSESTKSSYGNIPDSIVRSSRAKAEWERQLDRDFLELEDRILRSTVELEEAYNSLKMRKKKNIENDELSKKNSVLNGNVEVDLELEDSELTNRTEQEEYSEGMRFKERKPLEDHNLKGVTSVSNKTEDNKQIDEVGEAFEKLSTETLELEHENEPGAPETDDKNAAFMKNENIVFKLVNEKDFYASQERILRKIQKLEEQRQSSGSLKSGDQRNSVAIQNEDAVINKQVKESEFKADEKKEASVLLENKIINKHEDERKVIEKQGRRLRALDLKVNLEAAQKSDLAKLTKRTPIPKSQIDAVDDRQEDKIINRDETDEKDILERQDTILRKALLLEDELEKGQKSGLMELQPISSCRIDTVDDQQAETCIPLMDEETVSIDLNNENERLNAEGSQINGNSKTNWRYFRSLSAVRKASVDAHLYAIRKGLRDRRNAASKSCNCCKSIGLFSSALFLCSLYIAVLSIVPIAMVVIGSLYLQQCPVQPYIPIYLVVGGAFGIFYNCISVFRQNGKSASYSCFDGILNLFLFIWFILGCVWVYGVNHVEFYVTTDPDYCHQTCYNFAYWLFNVIFILIGAAFGLVCCAGCCGACCAS